MEINVSASTLNSALKLAGQVAANVKSTTMPILTGVAFVATEDGLELLGTDFETSLRVPVPSADIVKPGAIVMPVKLLSGVLRNCGSETVNLKTSDKTFKMRVKADGSIKINSQVNGYDYEEYPPVPAYRDSEPNDHTVIFTVPCKELRAGLARTLISCAPTGGSRMTLEAVNIVVDANSIKLASADGFRLTICEYPIPETGLAAPVTMLTPTLSAKALAGLLSTEAEDSLIRVVTPTTNMGKVGFVMPQGTEVGTGLVGGTFPTVDAIVPKNHTMQVTIDRAEFARGLDAAKVFSNDNAHIVLFVLNRGEQQLNLFAQSVETGSQAVSIPCTVDLGATEGDTLEFALNNQYVLDPLHVMQCDTVILTGTTGRHPFKLEEGDTVDYTYVCMPMHVEASNRALNEVQL